MVTRLSERMLILRRLSTDWLGFFGYLARGDEPHFVRAERAFTLVRWFAILIVTVAAPFAEFSAWHLIATYATAAIGALYTLLLQVVVIRRHPEWLSGGYLTSVADTLLISLAVLASGGASSPLFLAYFVGVASMAVRFGMGTSFLASVLSIGLFSLVAFLSPNGAVPSPGDLLIRFGFLSGTGVLAGYLAKEAQESRTALSQELRRTQELHRASEILARENAELSASLRSRLQELEQTQVRLVQSAKLAAIGELAANVAHEINNPLTAILTTTELLAEDALPDSPDRADLLMIRAEALRARSIVRSLLDFARQTPATMQPCEPREILDTVLPLVRKRAALGHVEITLSDDEQPHTVVADGSQLQQVFLNLLNNAMDAMAGGGRIHIELRRVGNRVVITFGDTGTGIRPEHIDRIFEPFFTTKQDVSGTGLGLSISYGIVQRHGGSIKATSSPGKGAIFTISLPSAGEQPTVKPDAGVTPLAMTG